MSKSLRYRHNTQPNELIFERSKRTRGPLSGGRCPSRQYSSTGRREGSSQRWPGIADVADAPSLTRNSLLTLLLETPHPAVVLVLKDALDGNSRARRIRTVGTSENHQRNCHCESSSAKPHKVS
jgi:hypothetical protein